MLMKTDHRWRSICFVLLLALVAAIVVASIWQPFGFELGGLIEEWGVLGAFTESHAIFWVSTEGPLAVHALRPLTVLPQAVAYTLDSNSFFYWHVLLIVALIIKGAASGLLVWKGLGSRAWALVAVALVLLYPADTMQLSFRALHINWALAIALTAASLSIVGYGWHNRLAFGLAQFGGAALLFFSCCMYEASLPFVLVPLLFLYATHGAKGVFGHIARRPEGIILWLTGLVSYALYVLHVAPMIKSYQGSLASGTLDLPVMFDRLFEVGALRALAGGWWDAAQIARTEFVRLGYLFVAVAIISVVLMTSSWVSRIGDTMGISRKEGAWSAVRSARFLAAAFAMMLIGYAPFLVSPAHVAISQRTYLFATPGAAMCWIGFLSLAPGVGRKLSFLVVPVLIFFGLAAQLFQFHHYIDIYRMQQNLLRTIVEHDDVDARKSLVVVDRSGRLGKTWMLDTPNLHSALEYLDVTPTREILICSEPGGYWQVRDGVGRSGSCVETPSTWEFRAASPVTGPGYTPVPQAAPYQLSKSEARVLTIEEDGLVHGKPITRFDGASDGVSARRYRNILMPITPTRGNSLFVNRQMQAEVDFDFGRWWSLEVPIWGTGWREPEWASSGFKHVSSAWKVEPVATLDFEFQPMGLYSLEGRVNAVVNEKIRQSIRVSLNGQGLDYVWTSPTTFSAMVPEGNVKSGRNRLQITSDVDDDYYGLSLSMRGFRLRQR